MRDFITAIVPTSPIPSHPSTDIIDKTIASIRHHFPDIRIFVMCDGVRPEQESLRTAYRRYATDLMIQRGPDVYVYHAGEHIHQIGLMRRALEMVKTSLYLFCEHDTPLVTDEPIEWAAVIPAIVNGHFDFIRFLPEACIHPEHEYLMRGTEVYNGATFTKTVQFSARPHLATRDFYLRVLNQFSPDANSFIEDRMHSVCQSEPWENWRMGIYTPPGGNAKRSLHLDGRHGAEKFDDRQVF